MDGVDCHELELEGFALPCFLFASGTVSDTSGALSCNCRRLFKVELLLTEDACKRSTSVASSIIFTLGLVLLPPACLTLPKKFSSGSWLNLSLTGICPSTLDPVKLPHTGNK